MWRRTSPMEHFNSQPHKEADVQSFHFSVLYSYFNSQPHKEADCNRSMEAENGSLFQLTASQGG